MQKLAASGARVIYTTLAGSLNTYAASFVASAKIGGNMGYQWIGSDKALQGFDVSAIPNVQSVFDGMMFWTAVYGMDPDSIGFQSVETGPMYSLATGGLDPVYARDRSIDLAHMSIWSQMQYRVIQSTLVSDNYVWLWAIQAGTTLNPMYFKQLAELTWYGGSFLRIAMTNVKFNRDYQISGYTGAWVQMRRCVQTNKQTTTTK